MKVVHFHFVSAVVPPGAYCVISVQSAHHQTLLSLVGQNNTNECVMKAKQMEVWACFFWLPQSKESMMWCFAPGELLLCPGPHTWSDFSGSPQAGLPASAFMFQVWLILASHAAQISPRFTWHILLKWAVNFERDQTFIHCIIWTGIILLYYIIIMTGRHFTHFACLLCWQWPSWVSLLLKQIMTTVCSDIVTVKNNPTRLEVDSFLDLNTPHRSNRPICADVRLV